MARSPARRPPRHQTAGEPTTPGSPVEVRIIGHDSDVHRLVAALQEAAGRGAGPVSFRASRYSAGATRAYLTVVIPTAEEQP